MTKKQAIELFQEQKVRTVWDDKEEKWYFSIVDVCAVLADSDNPQNYWRVLKSRLKKEGNETITNCNALKMQAADGKMRMTDVAAECGYLFDYTEDLIERENTLGFTLRFPRSAFA